MEKTLQEKTLQTSERLLFPGECLVCKEVLSDKYPIGLDYPVCSEVCYGIYATWRYRRKQCLVKSNTKIHAASNAN